MTINGTTCWRRPSTPPRDFALNAAAFDLSAFGVPSGGSISQLFLTFNRNPGGSVASTSLVGALDTSAVPEPSTWAMMLIGGLGYAGYRGRAFPSKGQGPRPFSAGAATETGPKSAASLIFAVHGHANVLASVVAGRNILRRAEFAGRTDDAV